MGDASMIDSGDTAWVLTSTALVLFMTLPGLGLFYAGLVQSKNILSVLMHCIAIACLVSVLWFAIAYSLAFSAGSGLVGGLSKALLIGVARDSVTGTIPETVFVMFQMTFAIITPALIVGAFVERVRFSSVLVFTGLWLILVYAPVAHWVWGGGWLAQRGVLDFAGGIVVHMTAGVSALTIAWLLGPRPGFPDQIRPPHAPWLVMVGASMLWVGWFGFNAGSALTAGQGAGMAMLVTHLSAAVASLVWMVIEWMRFGKPSSDRVRHRHDRRPCDHHAGLRLRRPGGRNLPRACRRRALLHLCRHREEAVPHRRLARCPCGAWRWRGNGHACLPRSLRRRRSAELGWPRA